MNEEKTVLTFYIYGKKFCPRRVLAATKNYNYFIENGLHPVDDPKKADLIVIHSCGGFNLDEEFSLLTLEKALKDKSKSSTVIMSGCLPKINKKAVEAYDGALIIHTEDLSILDSIINARVPYNSISESSIIHGVNDLHHGTFLARIRRNIGFVRVIGFNRRLLTTFKHYLGKKVFHKSGNTYYNKEMYKIEIAHGCLGNCTYCAIKFAMPAFHSAPEEQIIENLRFGLKQNYTNFALTGADIGAYGIDIGTNLANLLEKLFAVEGNYKMVLVDLNARWLIKNYKELIVVLKKNAEKVSKIIIPIQSGSNRILGLMKRHYNIDDVRTCILDLHKSIPTLKIETHLLVGFPGETDEDFQMSLSLLKDVPFSKVEIYTYEDRPGTAASKMTDKISAKTLKKRVSILADATNDPACVFY